MMIGKVSSFSDLRFFGVINYSSNRKQASVLAFGKSIEPDNLGRRYLISGETVSFRLISGKKNKAVDVMPIDRPAVELSDDYHEEITLVTWNGEYGFADRALGGRLFVH